MTPAIGLGTETAAAVDDSFRHPDAPAADERIGRGGALAFSQRWLTLLARQVLDAQAAGELDPTADPSQIAFELNAYMVLGNMQFVATSDPAALDRVRQAVDSRLAALTV